MIMLSNGKVFRYHPQTARHSEVQEDAAGRKVYEQVFGAAASCEDRLA